MTVKQLSDGNPDGAILGQSGDKIGFFGTSPSAKKTGFTAPVDTAAATTSYGFTEAQANAIVTWIRAVDAELKAKGLIGS